MLRCEAQSWIEEKRRRVASVLDEFGKDGKSVAEVATISTSVQAAYTNELLEQILLAVSSK